MRKVILHYHLFKNAGTSIDHILKASFADRWANFDKKISNAKISPAEMQDYIEANPRLKAISSHHVVPPLPHGDFTVFPIVFFRHPIDRIKSSYLFEWQKQKGTDIPIGSLKEYIEEKFSEPRANAIENFHVMHLANQGYEGRCPSKELSDNELLARAKTFVDNIHFFGVVELFNESLVRLLYYLKMAFPEFKAKVVRENVSQDNNMSLEQRIESVKNEIGSTMFNQVCERNKLDLILYDYAFKKFITPITV